MVLKYMNITKTWSYIEAKYFTVGQVIINEPPKPREEMQSLHLIARELRFKEAQIREEIGIVNEKITVLTGNEGLETGCRYVIAVADTGEQTEAFVLTSCRPAYLMTDDGKTIERIA